MIPFPFPYIDEVCRRRGWRFRIIDPFAQYLAVVETGDRRLPIAAGRVCGYPINSATAAAIARDKAHTAVALADAGFSVVPGEHFFVTGLNRDLRPAGREWQDCLRYADSSGYPFIVKPNSGSRGILVDLVQSRAELEQALGRIAPYDPMALLQRPVTGVEYRLLIHDGTVRYAYRRGRPEVIGDGDRTIEALLAEADQLSALETTYLSGMLTLNGWNRSSVLPKGARLPYSVAANIARGAEVQDFTRTVPPAIGNWAAGAARALNLRVCGLDVFAPEARGLSDPDDLMILEVNSNPSVTAVYEMGERDLVLDLWDEVLTAALNDG